MAKHRGGKGHEEEGAGEAWLLPYSDLMTLLLAVFIVLYAVSNVDATKASAASAAFRSLFQSGGAAITEGGAGILTDGDTLIPQLNMEMPVNPNANANASGNTGASANTGPGGTLSTNLNDMFSQQDLEGLETLQEELQTYFQHTDLEDDIFTNISERGLVISLTNSILFDPGSAEIKPEYQSMLIDIGSKLNSLTNYIRVEGHTDNVPVKNSSAIYPSNWELSGARAARVVRLFIDQAGLAPDRLVFAGYGEFKPVADNDTAEGRSENRRVDIIVLNMKYDALEQGASEPIE